MKSEDLIHILCRLTSNYCEFDTEQCAIVYEFSRRKYDVTFKRIGGKFCNFTVEDIGEVIQCEK